MSVQTGIYDYMKKNIYYSECKQPNGRNQEINLKAMRV